MPVDSSVMPAAIVLLVIGGMTLVNWGFAMFSDHWYADLVRHLSNTWFNLGRNTESVITPSIGMFCMSSGLGMLLYPDTADTSVWGIVLGGGGLAFLALAVVGLIPFRWPGPMYPEWQLERRRRREQEAARASWEHEAGGVVSRGRHAAPPETATDAGGRYGQYAGDAGGEDPLRSGDSLPMRARSPRDEDSGGGPRGGENV